MDVETIIKVASLARLNLTNSEISGLSKDIGNVLKHVDQLSQLNTDDVEPLAHPGDILNALREDEIQPSTPRADILKNAPRTDGEFYLVPAVLGPSAE